MSDVEKYLECLHCENFLKCELKKNKITDRCVNFEERKDLKNERRVDKTSQANSKLFALGR